MGRGHIKSLLFYTAGVFKFSANLIQRNPSGTTNREKLKNKPFQLVKHSEKIKRKKNLAFNDQQKK
eukprot:103746-Amorphochlora_amoeboformis.AAC.1